MRVTGRRFFVPEIVQSSAMDCGPAALKALLDGHGIPVSYGRLREVCQTDVDGTSIDTLEEVAFGLGLEAEQIMVPVDHVLLPEANALPAIAVVQLPNGNTHFIVVWSRQLGWVQIMDPGFGRHWIPRSRFLSELYQHRMPVPAADWREWAGSDEAIATLRRRIANLGIPDDTVNGLVETSSVPSWYPLACLDASTRAADVMVRSGAIRTGREAARALESLYKQARENESDPDSAIPMDYWSVRAATAGPDKDDEEDRVHLRGAVLVRARGRRPTTTGKETPSEAEALSPDLESVLEVEPVRPLREIFRFLKADGLLAPTALIGALLGASMGVLIEALLFRNLLELGPELGVSGQRLGAFGALILLLILLLCIEIPIATGEYRLGRRLEARLRMAFQRKIPLLADRYFRSRLTSDMAERNHSVHTLRTLPKLGSNFIRRVFEMLLTVAGIIWLDPPSAAPALSVAAVALGIPLATMSLLEERELRVRTHVGALSRFYLDALLGLTAVFAHSAGRAIRSEHEGLLTEWARSRLSLMRGILAVEAVPAFLGFGLSAWLLLGHLGRGGELGVVLLLAYWALNLPVLGLEIAWLAWQYPTRHNIMLRFLEPLGAPEETVAGTKPGESVTATGAAIQMQNVTVRSGGHVVLREIDLALEAGDHVAVVGASGAGKTSLFGLLLGWHRPAIGNVRVDGEALEAERLSRTRAETAWVDPAIQIWNRSLLENLQYGSADAAPRLPSVVDQAELRSVLEKLPEGYQTKLGEGGGLVSGGEGQRVRLGRALLRPGTRLVLLDEPFRGLARAQRRDLLRRARSFWNEATLLCVTHDIAETRLFDRVLVMEGGSIFEDGAPSELEARAESRYRSLLSSERRAPAIVGRTFLAAVAPRGRADSRDGTMTSDWTVLAWPRSRLGEAITLLARRSGLDPKPTNLQPLPGSLSHTDLGDWMFIAAQTAGVDIKPVGCLYPELRKLLRESGPSIMCLTGQEEPRFLMLLEGSSRKVRLLGTDLDVHTLSIDKVHEALCGDIESPIATRLDSLLDQAGVSEARRAKSRALMMKERLSRTRVGEGWLLRNPPGDRVWQLARSVKVPRHLFLFATSYTTQYLLWILSWWVIGKGVLEGRLDPGWLLAWGLCLLSQIPFLLWSSLYQSLVEMGVGGLLKQRLLQGALQLHPDEMRRDGAGHHLGRVLESEAVEKMVLSGGFVTLASSIELGGAAIVLSLGCGGLSHSLLLVVWLGLTVLLGKRYLGQRRAWADARLGISHDLIEKMVGHRTRLAQQRPERWHETEDQELERYLDTSSRVNRTAALMTLIPRGWLVVGLLGLAPAFIIGGADPAGLAIGLGGVILSFRAMRRFTNGFEILVDAAVAWRQVAPLFHAAARSRSPGDPAWSVRPPPATTKDETMTPLVEADDLVFRFRDRADPVLNKCSFRIGAGDQILLESPSGGGKSTLVSLLNGLREPDSGLLLLHGLDQRSLGDQGWTKRIAAAPQFHENHVITETFLFNLLMGRRWPPRQTDINEAKTLCHELGLGPLLEHMPAGLLQMVGETGWQLSHGEKSRLYLARALLQGAELAVLDESFAALDPDNLKTALECAQRRAGTLLLIAHP